MVKTLGMVIAISIYPGVRLASAVRLFDAAAAAADGGAHKRWRIRVGSYNGVRLV
jgi:hypothetical protein